MEQEIWSVESISSGSDDLFEAIITAEYGTKLIAQVPFSSTASEIVRLHNELITNAERAAKQSQIDVLTDALVTVKQVYEQEGLTHYTTESGELEVNPTYETIVEALQINSGLTQRAADVALQPQPNLSKN